MRKKNKKLEAFSLVKKTRSIQKQQTSIKAAHIAQKFLQYKFVDLSYPVLVKFL